MRDEFTHLTMVEVDVIGEPIFAQDRARLVAFEMSEILRFMSPPAVSWNIPFGCFPAGYEHEPRSTVIQINGERMTHLTSGLIYASSFRWHLSFKELDDHMTRQGFRNCAVFFGSDPLTGFQKKVKTSISAYARAIAAIDLRDRLINAMSAAEHLLLRDDNEPIQASVGDRMAFLIAKESDERRAVAANFKKAYGLRSRQVHHLGTVDDEDTLGTFFMNMWSMLLTAMRNMPRFKEHSEFLNAIERVKFA